MIRFFFQTLTNRDVGGGRGRAVMSWPNNYFSKEYAFPAKRFRHGPWIFIYAIQMALCLEITIYLNYI